MGEALEEITSVFLACCHPLAVLMVFCEASVLAVRSCFENVHTDLSTAEDCLAKDKAKGTWSNPKDIVSLRKKLTSAEDLLRSIKLATAFLKEEAQQLQVESRQTEHAIAGQDGAIATGCIENRLAVLSSTLSHLDSFNSLQRRFQSQCELVSHDLSLSFIYS